MPNVKSIKNKTVIIPAVFYTPTATQIVIDPEAFRTWREAQAEANAAKAKADSLRTLANIPDSKGFALMLGLELKPTASGNAVFVDPEGNPVGKLSVFYMPERTIPACFSNRIS